MSPPGRKPTPTNLRVLRGNPGKRAFNREEPEPLLPPAPPEPPDYLTGYGREEWQRIAEELFRLKLLTVVDIQPLAAYCEAYDSFRTATEKLREMAARDPVMAGLLVKTSKGGVMQNPLFLTKRQSANDMVRYATEFGFTPAARSRISTIESERTAGKFDGLIAS